MVIIHWPALVDGSEGNMSFLPLGNQDTHILWRLSLSCLRDMRFPDAHSIADLALDSGQGKNNE
jgi:hypothetical protein